MAWSLPCTTEALKNKNALFVAKSLFFADLFLLKTKLQMRNKVTLVQGILVTRTVEKLKKNRVNSFTCFCG